MIRRVWYCRDAPEFSMSTESQPVRVTNLDIGFFQMIWLMIKWLAASIIASVVVGGVLAAIGAIGFAALAALGLGGAAMLGGSNDAVFPAPLSPE